MLVCAAVAKAPATPELTPMGGWDTLPKEKAEIFERKLREIHDVNGMIMSEVRVYTEPDGSTWVYPGYDDSGYWTGNYLLGECLRYAVTKNPEAKENAERSARALIRMVRVSGKPGLLVRGYMDPEMSDRFRLTADHSEYTYVTPDGKFVGLDTSIDQLIGAMQGFHYAYRYVADDELKKEIAEVVTEILDHIMEHDYTIENLDGKPTTWGVFTPFYVIPDLHAFLILVAFKIGYYITQNPKCDEAFRFLCRDAGYCKKSRTANLLPSDNYSDDAMEFVGYINALELEDNPKVREIYLSSLRRTWKKVKNHDKSLFNLIALHYLDDLPDRETVLQQALDQIKNFPTIKEHHTADYSSYERPDPKRPNPIQYNPLDCGYYWTANPFVNVYHKPHGHMKISSGVDFIMVYWLARYWGYLKE